MTSLLTAAALGLALAAARAQTGFTNRPVPQLRFGVGLTNAASALAAPRAPLTNQDPLNALMTSAASVDVESPVTAQAEFDPPVIPPGQRAVYRLVVTAMTESVTLPDQLPTPDGLQLVPGGRGQIYNPVGARIQPRTSINFTVTARTNGTFVMPSYNVTVYGKPVKVPEARLTVVPAGGGASIRELARMTMELPAGDIYVGQTLRVRVMLPDRGDGSLLGLSQVRVTGDSLINDPFIFSQRRETVQQNGRQTLAFVQEVTVTPIAGGKQTLVAQGHAIQSRMIPGQVGILQTAQVLVDSDPVVVEIKSLPEEGRLPGFTGAIGTFSLDPPKVNTNDVHAGELVSLRVSIKGGGNIGRLVPPEPPPLRDWQVFPPAVDPSAAYVIQQRGSNVFTYTLIPLHDRLAATPAIPFSFFDPQKKAYVDLTIPPVALRVRPPPAGAGPIAQGAGAGGADEEAHEPELALTGLAEKPGNPVASLVPVQSRPWFLLLQLAPAFALAGLLGWDRRRRHLEQHPELIRKRQARRELRSHLRLVRRAAAAGDSTGYVTGAVNSLRAACAPGAGAEADALVCADVLRELPAADRQGSAGAIVRRIFMAADALRFGSGGGEDGDLLATRAELEQLLDRLKARL